MVVQDVLYQNVDRFLFAQTSIIDFEYLGEETPVVNGANRTNKTKVQRNSSEQAAMDADDEQDREKNIPIAHDVADIVWVKMGGHPW